MKQMYKGDKSEPVQTYKINEYLKDGWSFKKGEVNAIRQEAKEEKASEETKEVKLTKTHKKALELGLEIYNENGELIHHKTLAKHIAEADYGDSD